MHQSPDVGKGGEENPGAFPNAGPILLEPDIIPESTETLGEAACHYPGKSAKKFQGSSIKLFLQRVSDSHSIIMPINLSQWQGGD